MAKSSTDRTFHCVPSHNFACRLLSRQGSAVRCAATKTADKSASEWDAALDSFSIVHQKHVSSQRLVVILKHVHACKNGHFLSFQCVHTDPHHRSQGPDTRKNPSPLTICETKPRFVLGVNFDARIGQTSCHCLNKNLDCFDSTSSLRRTTIQNHITLKDHSLEKFLAKAPRSSRVKVGAPFVDPLPPPFV